jgi:hypothetical protein
MRSAYILSYRFTETLRLPSREYLLSINLTQGNPAGRFWKNHTVCAVTQLQDVNKYALNAVWQIDELNPTIFC